jgi:ubiquinone/menaquinone biosynthesis C-methylase UbiE
MPAAAPPELLSYYEAVAPFYADEMALRADLPKWRELVARLGARSVLDLGCGDGRVARALAAQASVVGLDLLTTLVPPEPDFEFVQGDMRELPFDDGRFDLAIAANDPFAHLLEDADRGRALDEAQRVAGRVVIDALFLPASDDARTRATGCVREAVLPNGTLRHETWYAIGPHAYRTTYRYLRGDRELTHAGADVRAWSVDEAALRGRWARLYGGLDGRPRDPGGRDLTISIGGTL